MKFISDNMKKKHILYLLAVCLMMGCSNSNISDEVETIQIEETSPNMKCGMETIDNDISAVRSSIPSAYKNIIDCTYEIIIADKADMEVEFGTTGVVEACIGYKTEEALSHIGYTLYDVDGNGVQELIIACNDEEDSWNNRILSMYSLNNDKPVLIIDGLVRSRFWILNNNTIYHEGSGGATYSIFATYYIGEDGMNLVPIDYYFSDYADNSMKEWSWFHNTTGESNVEISEIMELEDENDIWKLQEKFKTQIKQLILTPFSDYEVNNTNNVIFD